MNKLYTAMLLYLIVFMFMMPIYSGASAADHLKYPGNGISILSKNKPIQELNREIQDRAKSYKKISLTQNGIRFIDVSKFEFTSSRSIIGSSFCIKVPIKIDKGTCIIKIGDISYAITASGLKVAEKGRVVFETSKQPIDIIAEKFSPSNSSTRFHSKEGLIEIVHVNFSNPAAIQIVLTDNCSGLIGPWEWLRGYE